MPMFIKAAVAAIIAVAFATACVASMPEPQSFDPGEYEYGYAQVEDRAFFLGTWQDVWYQELGHDEQLEYCYLWFDDPGQVTAALMGSVTAMDIHPDWIAEAFASTCGRSA